MPSIFGISTSSVTTSGTSSWMRRAATKGSDAMTSMSPSASRTCVSAWRTLAESSTIKTRIFFAISGSDLLKDCVCHLPHGERQTGDGFGMADIEVAAGNELVAEP